MKKRNRKNFLRSDLEFFATLAVFSQWNCEGFMISVKHFLSIEKGLELGELGDNAVINLYHLR